jgi:methylase of polypeptide subunit release factors
MTKAQGLRDVFGWNLPFEPQLVGPRLLDLLKRGGLLHEVGNCLRSRVRVSSLGDDLFLHSAFPTDAPDAVFFGPDTYRFANFIREELKTAPAGGVVVDVGAGAGAGAITAARRGRPSRLVLTDVNARALRLAAANLKAAGLGAELIRSNGLDGLDCRADLIVANPPFIAGSDGHTYRDGGARHGAQLSLDWALSAVDRLNPGGRLLLYTGSAIVDGEDRFHTALATQIDAGRARIGYRELDPDIFGGMLGSEAYADVERIAAVGVVLTRS